VASKFARFKSGVPQHVEHTAREGVQNKYHWSWRPQTSHQNQNRVGQAVSRHHCCSCASVASSSFSLCQGGQWSFQALLLILTLCFCNNSAFEAFIRSLVESNSWYSHLAVVSYNLHFNAWESFNSQGKVVTPFRCSGHLVSHQLDDIQCKNYNYIFMFIKVMPETL